jgi:hypothetical protein
MYDKLRGQYLVPRKAASTSLSGSLASVNTFALSYVCVQRVNIAQLKVVVDTAIVSTAPVVVSFFVNTAPGVTAGNYLLGTITIPGGTPVGKVYLCEINPKLGVMIEGTELMFQCTTAAAGGGAAGTVVPAVFHLEDPEVPANEANDVVVLA